LLFRAQDCQSLGTIFLFDRPFHTIAPKFEDMPIVVMEQEVTAEAPLRAMNQKIDGVTKTAVFFSLKPDIMWEMAEEQ
jgi:hypothetical protein